LKNNPFHPILEFKKNLLWVLNKSDTILFDRAINSLQTLVHEQPTEKVIENELEPNEQEELKSILSIIKQLKQGDVK
jgi:hypothetical protein